MLNDYAKSSEMTISNQTKCWRATMTLSHIRRRQPPKEDYTKSVKGHLSPLTNQQTQSAEEHLETASRRSDSSGVRRKPGTLPWQLFSACGCTGSSCPCHSGRRRRTGGATARPGRTRRPSRQRADTGGRTCTSPPGEGTGGSGRGSRAQHQSDWNKHRRKNLSFICSGMYFSVCVNCVYVSMYALCVHASMNTYEYMNVCTYVSMHVCVHVNACSQCMRVYIYACTLGMYRLSIRCPVHA